MQLLVFDDDASVGRLMSRVAGLLGMAATAVTRADAFCAALRDAPPDIVMLDLQLGSTDGIEQVRMLAEQKFRGSLVLMSGFDVRVLETAATLARNLGLAVEGVLPKPIRIPDLERVLLRLQSESCQPSPEGLLAAIQQGELVLEFQPIVRRRPRTLLKLEALVRWNHPGMGRLSPVHFLEMAEAAPMVIDALTEWVFQAAIAGWQRLAELGIRVTIAANVSSRNLHDLSLPDRLEARLRAAAMPSDMLCLEITESAAFADAARSMDVLSRLRLKGMQLAIDDFGTGYASFKLLRQLPFCAIKIDQSFVTDMTTSRDSRVIVKSIIDLAANMEMESVAEGVETEAAADLLEQFNVGAMQGFLMAPAMAVETIPGWLAAWTASDQASLSAARGLTPSRVGNRQTNR